MARRIMRAFKLAELSAVDRPAQAHAKMTIMKRDDSDLSTEPTHDQVRMIKLQAELAVLKAKVRRGKAKKPVRFGGKGSHDESKHPRDRDGKFRDVPGKGDDAPKGGRGRRSSSVGMTDDAFEDGIGMTDEGLRWGQFPVRSSTSVSGGIGRGSRVRLPDGIEGSVIGVDNVSGSAYFRVRTSDGRVRGFRRNQLGLLRR